MLLATIPLQEDANAPSLFLLTVLLLLSITASTGITTGGVALPTNTSRFNGLS
jgi:hypothetical protein